MVLAGLLVLMVSTMNSMPAAAQNTGAVDRQWQRYMAKFMTSDGRILDTGNKGISHSEGQATGMLFALFGQDRRSYDRIWSWTKSNLWRNDGLFAWKWDPSEPENPVSDPNNATDGDILIAWALLLGADFFQEPAYRDEAMEIIRGMERSVVDRFAGRTILLPGAAGFVSKGKRIVNLSYCVFPALDEIAKATGHPVWVEIYRDCIILVQTAGFGADSLPLDWMELNADATLVPAADWPSRFGYDAIRIPLYLIWSGHTEIRFLDRFTTAWDEHSRSSTPPSWINPFTGETARYNAANGFLAVRRLVEFASKIDQGNAFAASDIYFPRVSRQDDYYSASLVLFSTLAALTLTY